MQLTPLEFTFALIAAILGIINVVQLWFARSERRTETRLRDTERRSRYLSQVVYEPLLDDIADILKTLNNLKTLPRGRDLRGRDQQSISFRTWEGGRDKKIGYLLKKDDEQLFRDIETFYSYICHFNEIGLRAYIYTGAYEEYCTYLWESLDQINSTLELKCNELLPELERKLTI